MKEWEEIKAFWKNHFQKNEVFIDHKEHIIGFEESKDSIVLIGYYHRHEMAFNISVNQIIDFIDFIKKIGGSSKYKSYRVLHLSNQRLYEIKNPSIDFENRKKSLANKFGAPIKSPSSILDLPREVEYYHVGYSFDSKSIILDLENVEDSNEASIKYQKSLLPWYHRLRGAEVITDSRFEDWEKWSKLGFKREWYPKNYDKDSFLNYWTSSLRDLDCYVDDRLMGFYFVWRYEKDDDEDWYS